MPSKKCGFDGQPGVVMCAECCKVLCKSCDRKLHKDIPKEHNRVPLVSPAAAKAAKASQDSHDGIPPPPPDEEQEEHHKQEEKKPKKKFHWADQVAEWGVPFKDSMALASIFMKWNHTEEDIDPDILDAKRLINIGIEGPNLQLCVDGVAMTYVKNNPEKIERQRKEAEDAAQRWAALEEEDQLRGKKEAWSKQKTQKTVFKADAKNRHTLYQEEEDREYEEALKANEKLKKKLDKDAEKAKRKADWFSWEEQLQEWAMPIQEAKKVGSLLEHAALTKKDIDPHHFTEEKMRALGISGTNLRLVMSGMKEHYAALQLANVKLGKAVVKQVAKVKLDDSDDDLPPAPYYVD